MTWSAALRVAVIAVLLAVLAGGIVALVVGEGSSGGIEITVPRDGEIRVHVAGAVAREGVYDLRRGDRVIEAVEAAGGLLPDAEIASLNLAARLTDGERIDIPRLDPVPVPAATPAPLDLNRATAAELEALPGIGPRRAQAILDYREVSGGFDRVEDLLLVEGIGPATLEALRPLVVVR